MKSNGAARIPWIKNISVFLFIELLCLPLRSSAQYKWNLERDKEGIKVYSSFYPESRIKALKVVCIVESTLSRLAGVLLDVNNQDEWFYHTKSTILKEISPTELYYYSELRFPFPMSNRDFIEHVSLSQNTVTKVLTMTVQNIPNFIPPKKGIIRVLHSQCSWTITPLTKKSLQIEFTLFADPAGSIPVWLVNSMIAYGPYETFKKLRTQLLKPEYQNATFATVLDE
jgi:hypothetical protein